MEYLKISVKKDFVTDILRPRLYVYENDQSDATV
jgi:hypothetical protein